MANFEELNDIISYNILALTIYMTSNIVKESEFAHFHSNENNSSIITTAEA